MDGKGIVINNTFIDCFCRNIKYGEIYPQPSDDGLKLYDKIKEHMMFYMWKEDISL
ncbi:hypothetical protein SAMN05444380_105109 [Thermophagus xiamenensis]|uniref:Uncharacterized protein n=1 Tax=Thermophagus xiamenensis TaxID=385682 RepID=A0A1I1X1M7_9BACT|nr:hypothetical protein SAMN05444380_105109 [Thermophagus xiamenensis]